MKLFKALSQAVLAAGLCMTAFAADDGKEMTITGCLDKGATASEYKLTDSEGKTWTVVATAMAAAPGTPGATPAAAPDLSKHAAKHTVKLSGKQDAAGGQQMFRAHKVEHVSDTCTAR